MSRVAIIGGTGQLAYDLNRRWNERHPADELRLLSHQEVEVSDLASVQRTLGALRPAIVINCSAFHKVDVVEDEVANAFAVNATGARNLALACRDLGAPLIHLSTDYVFSGRHPTPRTEDDAVDPIQVYGVSKVAGEQLIRYLWPKHFIVRGSGLYGVAGSSGKGGNFVETMLKLAGSSTSIKVVNDQTLTPTATWFLADQISLLATTDAYGTYHATCQGECTWYEFAGEVFRQAGLAPQVQPQTTAESGVAATRPAYSVLENRNLKRLGLDMMPPWREALTAYLADRKARIPASA
ncbi:MAG: dTDP-4-dehydrorhamnose reductase [Candidatus Dormibacter sp.]